MNEPISMAEMFQVTGSQTGNTPENRKCEKCMSGYITRDSYEEYLCLNCGFRPQGWVSTIPLRVGERVVQPRGKFTGREKVPGTGSGGIPGTPEMHNTRMLVTFKKSRLHGLPSKTYWCRLTYLQNKSFSGWRGQRSKIFYTPLWLQVNAFNFEWREYVTDDLVEALEKAFNLKTGNSLDALKSFVEAEKEHWINGLEVRNTQKP